MNNDYGKRVLKHYKIQEDVLWDLMLIVQSLCPGGEWVFQVFAHQEFDETTSRVKKKFMAICTNGDDNVTAIGNTPGAAVALLAHYLLDGYVFPLTGNGGRKTFPGDTGWTFTGTDESGGQTGGLVPDLPL